MEFSKILHAKGIILSVAREFQRPAVLWSSGKDSMVLLHLCRQIDPSWPVLFFREPWQPARYAFAQSIAADWRLELHDCPPFESRLATRNGTTSIMHRFLVAPQQAIDLPVDIVDDWRDDGVCGLDVMRRPKGSMVIPWDCLFHGAKSSDRDDLLGPMPLTSDLVRNAHGPAFAFPIADWTDADVWAYIEQERVPYQTDRYQRSAAGEMGELPDKTGNPDYMLGCMRCIDPSAGAQVWCPKLDMSVNNLSAGLPKIEKLLPDYIQPQEEPHAIQPQRQ